MWACHNLAADLKNLYVAAILILEWMRSSREFVDEILPSCG
jgi:hypothetical protein